MAFASEATIAAYREAWDDWTRHRDHLHRVFLEDEPIRPDQLKGLLNREARAKARFDAARLDLLGLAPDAPPAPDESPLS